MQDLSHPFVDGLQTYPADLDVHVSIGAAYDTDGYRSTKIETGSHAGTHVDAPAHVFPDGKQLHEYDLEAFVLDVITVDCRDYSTREAIPAGRVPEDRSADGVLFQTNWDEHWGTERYLDHPYLSPEAAELCVDRGFSIGVDTLNPDPTPRLSASADEPEGFPVHDAVLGAELLIFENLTNLDAVPERFEFRAHPLPLQVDGAPVRAVAVDN
ncbi:MAG: cyclase family protein [Halodesulfurarchaeum sp.]